MRTKWNLQEVPDTSKKANEFITYLRENNYPKPEDCKGGDCKKHRPSCVLGVCIIATLMCNDF